MPVEHGSFGRYSHQFPPIRSHVSTRWSTAGKLGSRRSLPRAPERYPGTRRAQRQFPRPRHAYFHLYSSDVNQSEIHWRSFSSELAMVVRATRMRTDDLHRQFASTNMLRRCSQVMDAPCVAHFITCRRSSATETGIEFFAIHPPTLNSTTVPGLVTSPKLIQKLTLHIPWRQHDVEADATRERSWRWFT